MKTTAIKFYWNGLKVNGEKKMIRCGYSINNNVNHAECVTIYARDYDDLPRDVFTVRNDTDIYTDYFDRDSTVLTPDHPLYKYALYAAAKAEIRSLKWYIEQCEKHLAAPERWAGDHDFNRKELARNQERLAVYEAMKNPGQPTDADLAKIEAARIEAENARKAAEHEEELRRREEALRERNEGRRYIEDIAEKYPIKDGEPVVTIEWSEHPAFYDWADGELKLSVTAAEIILSRFDREKAAKDEGYFKTKFTITWTEDGDEEPGIYEGRYDLGDNEGGLVAHIRDLATWELTHNLYGHMKDTPDKTNDRLEFAKMLKQFVSPLRLCNNLKEA